MSINEPLTSAPTLTDVIKTGVAAAFGAKTFQLPATVVDYDATKQTATIQIQIQSTRVSPDTGTTEFLTPPPIPGVPVAWAASTGFSLTGPLAAGDQGILLVMDRSMDEWHRNGQGPTAPADLRRNDLTDGIFLPCLTTPARALNADAVDPSAVVLGAVEIKLGSSNAFKLLVTETHLQNFANWFTQFQTFVTGLSTATTVAGPAPNVNTLAAALIPFNATFAALLNSAAEKTVKTKAE